MQTDREELIRRRAREIWEREGQPEGRAMEHWEQASREIDAETTHSVAPAGASDPEPGPKKKAGRPRGSAAGKTTRSRTSKK